MLGIDCDIRVSVGAFFVRGQPVILTSTLNRYCLEVGIPVQAHRESIRYRVAKLLTDTAHRLALRRDRSA
jgi:hypothetical protein